MSLNLIPIIYFAKILTWFLKLSNKGSGTALPGRIIEKFFPSTLSKLTLQIPNIIVITGTNGKTTTQTICRSILKKSNIDVITNSAGANMSRGILSELLKRADFQGRINCTHAIFEVEEGTLPKIVKILNPKIIAVTNLYRDQLDAYGEVDITERYIREAIKICPNTIIILNKNDPRTSKLTKDLPNETHYVSLPSEYIKSLPYEGDQKDQIKILKDTLNARNIIINSDLSTIFNTSGTVNSTKIEMNNLKLSAPGYFHIYNALFSITIATLLGIEKDAIIKGIGDFNPAFGRGELIQRLKDGKVLNYRILLVKNPAGLSLNIDLIRKIKKLKLIILLNDNIADGRDISWIWDARFELLNNSDIEWIICGGIRAKDMRVRLKYALKLPQELALNENIKECIEKSFELAGQNETIFVLPTYTAMLEFRKLLGKKLEE